MEVLIVVRLQEAEGCNTCSPNLGVHFFCGVHLPPDEVPVRLLLSDSQHRQAPPPSPHVHACGVLAHHPAHNWLLIRSPYGTNELSGMGRTVILVRIALLGAQSVLTGAIHVSLVCLSIHMYTEKLPTVQVMAPCRLPYVGTVL